MTETPAGGTRENAVPFSVPAPPAVMVKLTVDDIRTLRSITMFSEGIWQAKTIEELDDDTALYCWKVDWEAPDNTAKVSISEISAIRESSTRIVFKELIYNFDKLIVGIRINAKIENS